MQEALLAATTQWRRDGIPDNPRGWLIAVGSRRLIDELRSEQARKRREDASFEPSLPFEPPAAGTAAEQPPQHDETLQLLFLCCHPALRPASQIALTLRAVGGLTTAEIANAFLVPEATMAQRISRAKQTIKASGIAFQMPPKQERADRLRVVLHVLYLIFNEGYTATAGEEWMRPDLADEAIRLARMLSALAPDEPEVLGLQALLEIQGSRIPARLDEDGAPVLLEAQDRSLWDQLRIRRGMAALDKAQQLAARGTPVGRYFLQASIAAQHARAVRAEDTDWRRIAQLYDVLARAMPGPVVEVNRAVAHGRAYGPGAGLAVLEEVDVESLGASPLVPSVRGDLLERTGLYAQAYEAFTEAASLSTNGSERTVLQRRADRNRSRGSDPGVPRQPTKP